MTCRTIVVANQKGGTAKTATALSLGVALARTGGRVLLVDADPQGDLTKSLGWRDPDSLETTLATHLSAAIEGSDDDPAAGTLRHREGVDLMWQHLFGRSGQRLRPASLNPTGVM